MGKVSPKITVICPCGKTFEVTQARLNAGRGRQCSVDCRRKYIKRPSGLKYVKHRENPTSFRRGNIPWNTGLELGSEWAWNYGMRGTRFSPETEFKPGENVGEDNSKWAGDAVGYFALHGWVSRHKEKPERCEWCQEIKPLDWANKSHLYLRELDDWLALCKPCHGKHDSGETRGAIARKYGR